jgi:hypothetical protein
MTHNGEMSESVDNSEDASDESPQTETPEEHVKKMKDKRLERDQLLEKIRRFLLKHPTENLDSTDPLPKELQKLSNDELRNIVRNIDEKNRLGLGILPVKGVISVVDFIIGSFTGGDMTCASAADDMELVNQIDDLVQEYTGGLPKIMALALLFSRHVMKVQPENVNNAGKAKV